MQLNTLIILLLCIIGKVRAQASTIGQNCSADTIANPENDDRHEGYFDVYSQGAYGRSAVEKLRSKPESYYQSLLDNAIMFLCDVPNASERCVEEDSPLAARDWEGSCIKASDFECPTGLCERASNCYWNTVKAGQNRTTRFEVDAYAKAADAIYGTKNSYLREIAEVGLIGIAISALLLISWILFFIGRYLCCCLWNPCAALCFTCSTVPRKEGYKTCQHIVIPALFYLVTLVAIIAAGSLAFVGNEDISVALTNAFLHADGLGDDLSTFLGSASVPLRNLHAIVDEAAVDAKTIFDDTDYIQDDAARILNSFVGFFELHSSGLNETNAMQQFQSVTEDFGAKITPITTNIQSMLDVLKVGLTEQVDGIKSGIDTALDQLESFDQLVATGQSQIYEYEGKELSIRDVRRALVMTLFIVSILVSMIGFFGILVWKSRVCRCSSAAIKATGFFSALLGSLSLVVASIFLCSSFILHDACKSSALLVRDFEPFVGDQLAVGVNACFNDTNLVVAFNMSESLSFQQVLDDELKEIDLVNVSEQFDMVIKPLSEVEMLVAKMSDKALSAINTATSANQILCPFNDVYTEEEILAPWELTRDLDSTPYIIRNTFGLPASYSRLDDEETSEMYLGRIYNIAGICSAPTSCCIKLSSSLPDVCESNIYDRCDHGSNCAYPCEMLRAGIVEGATQFKQVLIKELEMTADLGLSCPIEIVDDFDDTCPTQEFRTRYSNLTVFGQIDEYRDDIVATKDDLVSITTTSIGAAMSEVEDFICSLNGTFVERRYNQIKYDVCVTLQGGAAQINWALWILGFCLEIVAVLAHVLVVRKGGRSEKEVAASKVLNAGGRRTYVPAKIYSRATV